jgi:methylenetetrahydrofolate--tRNA-(uracil-5-)-methyltransferase
VRTTDNPVTIIGAGLAGSEAAWQLAARGIRVRLFEMRPDTPSPAHHTGDFAELVCSNSLKSDDPETAPGLLKQELLALGSFALASARAASVPAGGALAVDRARFSHAITQELLANPNVEVIRAEVDSIPDSGDVIVATGPLTSAALEPALSALVGDGRLAFFDAAAPIVEAESVNRGVAFSQSRYDKGEGADYLNCPMDRAQYEHFVGELANAQRVVLKEFESADLFQACQPIEEIARRGADALRFGPFKPVGLTDPTSGERPWAVLQLRSENRALTAYNLVGCQTNLTFAEQKRVFGLVPGLEGASFTRFGVMHRNTFVDAPRLLTPGLALRSEPRVRLAGQLVGTEGYLEAAAAGLVAALDVIAARSGGAFPPLPPETALGSLLAYATDPATVRYQPMHVNFGLLPPASTAVRGKRQRHAAIAERAVRAMDAYALDHRDLLEPAFARLGVGAP